MTDILDRLKTAVAMDCDCPTCDLHQDAAAEIKMLRTRVEIARSSNICMLAELSIIEKLLADPSYVPPAHDMDYWTPLHDKLQAALNGKS
jgi:hypothetical protein